MAIEQKSQLKTFNLGVQEDSVNSEIWFRFLSIPRIRVCLLSKRPATPNDIRFLMDSFSKQKNFDGIRLSGIVPKGLDVYVFSFGDYSFAKELSENPIYFKSKIIVIGEGDFIVEHEKNFYVDTWQMFHGILGLIKEKKPKEYKHPKN